MNSFLVNSKNFFVKILFFTTIVSYANSGLGQEEKAAITAPDNASKGAEEEADPKPATENAKPKKAEPAAKEGNEKINVAKSSSSKKLDNRALLGASVGWVSMRSTSSTWAVGGASSVFGAWRLSQKEDGLVYATGRYTPFAGTLKCDEISYDATGHGFFGGAYFLIPNLPSQTALKLGGELGFLKVYAKPQDGSSGDAKAKKSAPLAGLNAELDWTFLEKVQLGPFINAYFGGATIVYLGASTSLAF